MALSKIKQLEIYQILFHRSYHKQNNMSIKERWWQNCVWGKKDFVETFNNNNYINVAENSSGIKPSHVAL